MAATLSRRPSAFAALALALAAGAAPVSLSAAPSAAPAPASSMSKARPAVVDKAVRRDPYARRKAKPRSKPRDPSDFDHLRIARAQERRARRQTRVGGSATIRKAA